MKTIAYTSSATRQLRRIPAGIRERLIAKLHRYAETGAGDVVRLTGQAGARLRVRLRVGDYRIVFAESKDAISVRAVGHRRDIYQ